MKKIILFLFLISSQTVWAQSDVQIIRKDFEKIIALTRQQKINEILDMTYPRLFTVMPKEQVLAMAKATMTGMGMKMVFEQNKINLNLSKVTRLSAATICIGAYDQHTIIEFTDPKMVQLFMMAQSADMHTEKLSEKKIRLIARAHLLAIKDTYTKGSWKYLNYNQTDAANNAKILSKEIQSAIPELKSGL